jgi:hypothetical protein
MFGAIGSPVWSWSTVRWAKNRRQPPGGTFLQSLRDDRDKTLAGFVRAIFKSPRSAAEVEAMVRGAKRMPVESSIALLSYPFVRTH